MRAQSNFEKYIKDFPEYGTRKIKGAISVYLKIYHMPFIADLLQQGFTEKMVFLMLLKKEPSLSPHLKYNTYRSFVRKNIKKGELKADKFNIDSSVIFPETSQRTTFNSEVKETAPRDKLISTPQEPLHPANREALIELTGFELDEFYVDSNGFLFDGFSSDKTTNLAPVPNQFQILAQQDGIKKHYFLYKDQTIDSKTILQFIKEKIRTGTLSLTFRKL